MPGRGGFSLQGCAVHYIGFSGSFYGFDRHGHKGFVDDNNSSSVATDRVGRILKLFCAETLLCSLLVGTSSSVLFWGQMLTAVYNELV